MWRNGGKKNTCLVMLVNWSFAEVDDMTAALGITYVTILHK